MTDIVVIGAGPAGLMAAETAAGAGAKVLIVDAMPSVGRKFLMAGKSGLNLTKDEDLAAYLAAFGPLPDAFRAILAQFGPEQVMDWATGLGQPLFTGSTGRVFPTAMKASPLLRAWMARLAGLGVQVQTRWHWDGWDAAGGLMFQTPQGPQCLTPPAVVLALGGASWARLGSTGAWARHLADVVAPFEPANMGLMVDWSAHMALHFGAPVKAVAMRAGTHTTRGECIISARGIEGGGIYALARVLRQGAPLVMDLAPDWTLDQLRSALAKPRGKTSLSNHLRKVARLDPLRLALFAEFGRPYPADLASLIKGLVIRHAGPRPLDEAISTAGGVQLTALRDDLMLYARRGVFCAGEMLDWEAPTGGYLISASLATGRCAGQGAAAYALN
jgi:uncharacterized flavoprotein (TIGR03862 family)